MTQAAITHPPGSISRDPVVDSVYSRISWRLLPFIVTLWVLAWIDRVNIGYAKLTMLQDLQFSEAVYGLGAGIFFLGYFFFEVPSNLLLEKIGAKKTIMRITIGWGIVCILQMFVTTATQFYFLRFLLGAFEAGFFPGIILYLTYWYPTLRRARAFGIFMSASALAGVLGGPIAGWILAHMNTVNGWSGWQWVFLLEGIPSILMGLATWAYLTDKPENAGWLTAADKQVVQQELARDREHLGVREHSILASLKDPKIWLMVLIFFCIVAANSAMTFFGPTLVRGLGFTDPQTIGWIMAIIYLCGAAGMILNGRHSDHAKEERLHCGIAALVGAIGIAGVATIGNVPALALPALALGIVGTMSAIPVFWQLPNLFLAGSAAACGIALINSIANLAGFGAPWFLGVIKTNTGEFTAGLYTVAVIEALALVLIVVFVPKKKLA